MNPRLLLIGLLCLTSACGFHLRGSLQTGFDVANIYLQSSAAPQLEKALKSRLAEAGVRVADSAANARYTVFVKEETFEKAVLSVSTTTGKVEEYQLIYQARMDAYHADGGIIVENDEVRAARDFTFDENAVLGKFSEEIIIREDLVGSAANQVLQRLQALLTSAQ